jgi:hypothetical protein
MCPDHNCKLIPKKTKYGTRWGCPVENCTVVCWGGKTSTPANQELRTLRNYCHSIFDPIWKNSRSISRTKLYNRLAEYMKLPPEKAHIGMFNEEQCQKVIQFVKEISNGR